MNLSTTTLVILFAAFVLLYGAIRNVSPLGAIKNALTNKPPTSAAPLQKSN
jgi:hypothetical protein